MDNLTVLACTCTCLQLHDCIQLQESTSLSEADHTEQTVHHSSQCATGPQHRPEVYCGTFLRDLSTCTGIPVVMETPTDLIQAFISRGIRGKPAYSSKN